MEPITGRRNPRRRASPTRLCRRLDLLPQNFFNWADQGLLTKPGPAGCSLLDAIELAVFLKLKQRLGLRKMRQLWGPVKEQLRQRLSLGDVLLIYDQEGDRILLALTHDEVGQLVSHGGIVRVISAADYISRVREAFEKPVAKLQAQLQDLAISKTVHRKGRKA